MMADDGVTARLGYIRLTDSENYNPIVVPYPDFSWFQKGDCNGITSVFNTAVSFKFTKSQFFKYKRNFQFRVILHNL